MGYIHMRIDGIEHEKYERALEEFASNGEFITWYNSGIAYLADGKKQNVRYAVEAGKADDSKKAKLASLGWNLVSDTGGVTIFRNDDPDAPPLHPDPAEYADVLRGYHSENSLKLALVYILSGVLPFIAKTFFTAANGGDFYYSAVAYFRAPFKAMLGVSLIGLAVCAGFAGSYHRTLIKAEKAAAAASEDRAAAAKTRRRGILLKMLAAFAYIMLAASAVIFAFLSSGTANGEWQIIDQSEVPSYVLTADDILDGENHRLAENWDEYIKYDSSEDYAGEVNSYAVHASTGLASDYYSMDQHILFLNKADGPAEPFIFRSEYASLISETLAKRYFKESVKQSMNHGKTVPSPDISDTDIDELIVIPSRLYDSERILARKDCEVYEFYCSNSRHTDTIIKNIKKKLSQ